MGDRCNVGWVGVRVEGVRGGEGQRMDVYTGNFELFLGLSCVFLFVIIFGVFFHKQDIFSTLLFFFFFFHQ